MIIDNLVDHSHHILRFLEHLISQISFVTFTLYFRMKKEILRS